MYILRSKLRIDDDAENKSRNFQQLARLVVASARQTRWDFCALTSVATIFENNPSRLRHRRDFFYILGVTIQRFFITAENAKIAEREQRINSFQRKALFTSAYSAFSEPSAVNSVLYFWNKIDVKKKKKDIL